MKTLSGSIIVLVLTLAGVAAFAATPETNANPLSISSKGKVLVRIQAMQEYSLECDRAEAASQLAVHAASVRFEGILRERLVDCDPAEAPALQGLLEQVAHAN